MGIGDACAMPSYREVMSSSAIELRLAALSDSEPSVARLDEDRVTGPPIDGSPSNYDACGLPWGGSRLCGLHSSAKWSQLPTNWRTFPGSSQFLLDDASSWPSSVFCRPQRLLDIAC